MALRDRIGPWSGIAYRHLPHTVRKADVLDFTYAGRAPDNRWNVKGDPTLYLACDTDVALAEWSRHFGQNTNPTLAHVPLKRTLWQLTLDIPRVLDMRSADVWDELQLTNTPYCFLDLSIAQTVGTYLRRVTDAQALLVLSVALLDKPDRWNIVLFLDKLPQDTGQFITRLTRIGALQAPRGLSAEWTVSP